MRRGPLPGPQSPELYLTRRDKREILSKLVLRETTYRYTIAAFVVLFALIGLSFSFSQEGPRTLLERLVAGGFCVSTIPVGLAMLRVNHTAMWWSYQTGYRHAPEWFTAYADIGLTAVLLTEQNATVAVVGSMLFAIIGTYVAHFVTPWVRTIHVIFTSCVIVGLGCWALTESDHDAPAVIAAVLVGLFVVNGTVALHSIYTTEVRLAIASKHVDATTDPLTGIPNRRAFNSRARDLIEASDQGVDVMLIDVDHFKLVNDTHGHDRGDQFLINVALAIVASVDPTAVVARLGGDEFAVATKVVAGQHYSAEALRQRVIEQTGIVVSVGQAATEPNAADSSDALSAAVAAADIALYTAKSARSKVVD